MITNPFEAKRPITTKPVLPASAVKRQPPVAALHFGSDSATLTATLPEWTKKVKDPKITLPEFCFGDDEKNKNNKTPSKLAILWTICVKKPIQGWRLYRDATANHDEYLPKQVRKDLRKYHWTPSYWFNRVFNSRKAKVMNVVYRGPLAIKTKQLQVAGLPSLYKRVKELEDIPKEAIFSEKLAAKINKFFLKRQIKGFEVYSSLLNKVPALPYSKFEKQLKELQSTYNNANSSDPIDTIDKEPIGTGSMGQVYKATTKSGEKLVLKVIKPEITPDFLDACLPLVYYQNMLLFGKKPQDKLESATKAQETINILKDEATPEKEANNTKLMQQWAIKLNIQEFQIPDLLLQTKSGLITRFVGDKDVTELNETEKNNLKIKLTPDLIKFFTLSGAKPLDLHEGNMRTGSQAYWIDHGRQININDEAHKKMLKLKVSVFKSPELDKDLSIWDNALLNTETRESLKDLLQINPDANKQALDQLKQLEQLGDITESVKKLAQLKKKSGETISFNQLLLRADDTEKKPADQEIEQLESSIQPFTDLQKQLSKILGQPPVDNPIARQIRKNTNKLVDPSLLNAWASSALKLPGYAQTQLPQRDITQYRIKSYGFMSPYIHDSEAKSKLPRTGAYTRQVNLITEKQEEKLTTLSNELAKGLLQQTESEKLNDSDYQQLVKNLKFTLRNDLLPESRFKEELPKE